MESKKNQIISLDGGLSYIILEHAVYKNENYYLCQLLTEDKKDLTENFVFIHELINDGESSFESVKDGNLIAKLAKYMS